MAVNRLLPSFHAWAADRPELEPDVADTIVDLKSRYLRDPQPGRWRTGDLEVVLLELLPKHVTADEDWYGHAVPTVRAFLQHARSEGMLHKGCAPVPVLMQELDAVEQQFPDAVRHQSRFGTAKTLLTGGGSGMPDLSDPAALQKVTDEFNARPFEERKALTDPFLSDPASSAWDEDDDPGDDLDDDDLYDELDDDEDDGEPLPPDDVGPLPAVRLAPAEELAAQVRANPFMRALEELVGWVGGGKPVTDDGLLAPEEQAAAISDLGLDERDEDDELADDLTDPDQIPRWRLGGLWDVAVVTELLRLDGGLARVGEHAARLRGLHEIVPDADDDLLALWSRALRVVTTQDAPRRITGDLAVIEDYTDHVVTHLLLSTYSGDLHSVPQVIREFSTLLTGVPKRARRAMSAVLRERLTWIVRVLVELGAVEPLAAPDDLVDLTPLGRFGVRDYAIAKGADAPLVGDVTALDAVHFVDEAVRASDDVRDELVEEWLGARGHSEGVEELLSLVRQGGAVTRDMAVPLLADALSEQEFEGLVARFADEPVAGPVLRAHIAERDAVGRLFERARSVFGPDVPVDELPEQMARLARRQPLDSVPELVALGDVLAGLGWLHADMSTGDRDVMTVERLALLADEAEGPVRRDDVPPRLWKLFDEVTLARLTKVRHPELIVALEAIATGHPSGRIRKAAKKAGHKLGPARRGDPRRSHDRERG